jgi:hypothetical protein
MSIKDGIFDIVGRTIKEVIVNEHCGSPPDYHLFILFDDGGAYEFYGNGNISSSSYDHGGLGYAKIFKNCQIKRYYIDDQGRKMIEDIK